MPIYPVLNKANDPEYWLLIGRESGQVSHEYWWEHISYAYLSNVKETSILHIFKFDLITSTWPIYMNKLVMNIDENIFRMPISPMLNHMNIDELNISFSSSHALWPECNQPSTLCPISEWPYILIHFARWRQLLPLDPIQLSCDTGNWLSWEHSY